MLRHFEVWIFWHRLERMLDPPKIVIEDEPEIAGVSDPTRRSASYISDVPTGDTHGRLTVMPSTAKMPRNEYDLCSGSGRRLLKETDPLGPAYDCCIRNGIPLYGATGLSSAGDLSGLVGVGMGRTAGTGLSRSALDDLVLMNQRLRIGGIDLGLVGKSRPEAYVLRDPLRRPEDHLPADASNTLFVEGLPADCARREAAHIFRPFVGFKEVRLVNKEPRHPGGDPIVLCFVDFANASCAATALETLQGYKFDESDRDSSSLRLQFARFPGPRGGTSAVRDRDDYASRSRR